MSLKEVAYPSGEGSVAIGLKLPLNEVSPGRYRLRVTTVDPTGKTAVAGEIGLRRPLSQFRHPDRVTLERNHVRISALAGSGRPIPVALLLSGLPKTMKSLVNPAKLAG